MSAFLDILTHGRRLQGAVKELSIKELEAVQEKLAAIIERRKEKAEQDAQAELEKQQKIKEIQQQMIEAGLDISDLTLTDGEKKKPKATGKKRPVKYKLTDKDGNEHPWTGIGRMPRVYKKALDKGKKLEDFAI
ncbi:H-NS histone family protein [Alteromonas sp. CYL-A6]|uniref:H-NS histone family protein n=1 Tax=Alteromonas nitratireducens TaxID=3390813 RepID=UPI0034BEF01A